MNLVYVFTLALITIATCINSVRWERIAQREHYIPSYVSKFYFRWVRSRGLNRFIFFTTLILCVVSLFLIYVPILRIAAGFGAASIKNVLCSLIGFWKLKAQLLSVYSP